MIDKVDMTDDVRDIVQKAQRFKTLCRNVLSSGQGRELLDELRDLYMDGKLYQETDRATIYAVAQRDLIMELIYNVQDGPGDPKPNGEVVS